MDNNTRNAFIGIGWSSPPTFVKGSDTVIMTKDVQNINENIKLLFSTRTGERVFNAKYGTKLSKLVFAAKNSLLENEIKESLSRAVKLYEPRVIVDHIAIDSGDREDGFILINLSYTVRKINSRHNYVYPFYINEGTSLDF